MSSMTIIDERNKVVDFSIPYANANLAILTPLKSDITNIKDLDKKGKFLDLKHGSTGHLYAVKNLKMQLLIYLIKKMLLFWKLFKVRLMDFYMINLRFIVLSKSIKMQPEPF